MLKTVSLGLCAAALAIGGCSKSASNNTAPTQPKAAKEAAGNQTIASTIDQNGKFYQAAKAVGLDATLAGPGPYTVLVPSDDAFSKVNNPALGNMKDPKNRAEITRILTYHILPGVILADDISKAIDNGKGKAVLATMGGETLTATKEGGNIVLSDASGGKATITKPDIKATNGVVHDIDAVLTPPKQTAPAGGKK
jgi:uncharacterized surface protein with fasciclin (FAS1) repeats